MVTGKKRVKPGPMRGQRKTLLVGGVGRVHLYDFGRKEDTRKGSCGKENPLKGNESRGKSKTGMGKTKNS